MTPDFSGGRISPVLPAEFWCSGRDGVAGWCPSVAGWCPGVAAPCSGVARAWGGWSSGEARVGAELG